MCAPVDVTNFRNSIREALENMTIRAGQSTECSSYGPQETAASQDCHMHSKFAGEDRYISTYEGEARRKIYWYPTSPCSKTNALTSTMVDSAPSTSFMKNPLVMGMFTSVGLRAPHSLEPNFWRNASSRRDYFSFIAPIDWRRSYNEKRKATRSPVVVKNDWISEGILRVKPKSMIRN
jgi:hypothetical protein